MKLRIAMVGACPYPTPQGSQVFMRDNALALKALGHEVCLVVYGYGVGRDFSGLSLHRCRHFPGAHKTSAGPSLAKPFLDLAMVATLRRVVREEKIDVVIAHNYEALLVALVAGKRPILYHAHNAMSDELPYYFRYTAFWACFGRYLDRNFPKRADCIITPHRRLAGHLVLRGCDHTKVHSIAPPIDATLFEPSEVAKDLPPVLYTGNLDAYQNLGLLFAAMERVRKDIPEARLLIATAEEAQFPDADLAPTKGFDDLQRLLAQDSVFAAPRVSWSGYPIKLLNAMAAGKAIVACESAAYPITHEHNGLVVPDNDEAAFATALLRLMRDRKLRAELGRHARESILADHQPEKVARQLEALALESCQKNTLPSAVALRKDQADG